MNQKIIFPTATGIAVITPTGELPILTVALKDVPHGSPFIIVDDSELPDAPMEAWEADFSNADGTGADYGNGTDWAVILYDDVGVPLAARHETTGVIRNLSTQLS